MIRLSQRGWNNVLIFAMLLMILLFGTTNNLLIENSQGEGNRRILPEDVPIMAIDYGQHKLERIGRGWRIKPNLSSDESQVASMVQNWQAAQGRGIGDIVMTQPFVVVVWLAGQEQGQVFKLMPQGTDVLFQSPQGTFLLQDQNMSDYIPGDLL